MSAVAAVPRGMRSTFALNRFMSSRFTVSGRTSPTTCTSHRSARCVSSSVFFFHSRPSSWIHSSTASVIVFALGLAPMFAAAAAATLAA